MRFWTWLAALAVGAMLCAPATAQKISDMPAATTPTGTEKVAGIQGSGCATHTTPCQNVAITLAQISTLASSSLNAKLVAIAGLSTSADTCFYFTSSTAVASYTCPSFGRSIATSASSSAARSTLGLVVGTDIEAHSANLTAVSGLTSASDKCTYWTGSGTAALYNCTATGRTFAGAASAGAERALLSVTSTVPGYVAGRYYWLYSETSTTFAAATAIGQVKLAALHIRQAVTLSELAIAIGTVSAGGNLQLGIYAMDATTRLPVGAPLATTGNLSTASAGMITGAIAGGNVSFAEGWYWLGVAADNTTATYTVRSNSQTWDTTYIGSTTLSNLQSGSNRALAYTISGTFGTWPNLTSTPATEAIAVEPAIAAKIFSVP